ncbi:Integral membrane sensor signal transduction histidine kinase [Candidatus Sulfopaludibacter sp. SbA6]|nr:Integral membrane sensor signal transduction histidine kinase [Candidatus Sulfopaludibacter sp. SbA6]
MCDATAAPVWSRGCRIALHCAGRYTGDGTLVKHQSSVGTRVAAAAGGILVVSTLHLVMPLSQLHWHNVFQHLYYLPIAFAGLSLGWRGGLAAALLAGISNAPHNLLTIAALPSYAVDQILDVPVFCATGVLTGVLAERGRKQRADLERTTGRLTEVYKQLQENFERMKRAERLFALGQLSAGLAHEIRNPLASIAGAAGILQRNLRLEQKDAECLAIIIKECQRLNHLLTHFLDFARPRAPKYQPTDVEALLDSVMALAAHAIGARPISLGKDVPPQMAPVECDPELMKQVILNLLINAIQATPDGGKISLSAGTRNGRVWMEVTDEGCGIDAADRDRIFDPFFTTKEGGTGLGLSVAHQIVEQHGGILTAEANPSRGMTFSVSLPLRQERLHDA